MSEETKPKDDDEELEETTLLSHLIELRSRLLKIAAAVVIVFVVLLPWSRDIFALVSAPLRAVLPGNAMIATAVASPLLTPFKLTFFVALFIAMPIVLYQVWAFVAPGLYKKEKNFAVPLLASSIALFYLGIAFAYYVVFPLIFGFFTAVAPDGVEVQTDISLFLDF
ncbi:MAG: twin-arginine translocase subunit TatC, partial [Acidiferrobacterales bacterium]